MRKLSLIGFVLSLALLVFGNPASAQNDKMKGHKNHKLTINLTGGAEVPGPGDADGSGMAKLTLNHQKGEVCYTVSTKKIQVITAVHIHSGAVGQSGDPKATLSPTAKGCVSVDKDAIEDMMNNPANYYINVHNAEFPNGALRGQLGK